MRLLLDRKSWFVCLLVGVFFSASGPQLSGQQDTKLFGGLGKAPVEAGYFGQDKKKEEARGRAERLALPSALHEALKHSLSGKSLSEEKINELVRSIRDNSPVVRSKQVTEEYFEDGFAHVKVAVKIDMKALQEHLHNQGISLTDDMAGKFQVFVLSYTVEGADSSADRSKPIVLRDEVKDERQNIQSKSSWDLKVSASSRSQSASLQASRATSDQGNVALQYSGELDAHRKSSASASAQSELKARGEGGTFQAGGSADARAESEASLRARESASGSANWDRRDNASLDARAASASGSYSKTANAGSQFSDTSTKYYRVTEFADPTKKGAGSSNQVRDLFDGMLKSAGFETGTMNLPLMDKSFNDDSLLDYVLSKAEVAGAKPDDYIAIVLNNLTPLSTSESQRIYSSTVSYRIIRVRDRTSLLPANALSRDSEALSNDMAAKTQATRLALGSVQEQLPAQIREGFRRLLRQEGDRAKKFAGKYVIQIEDVQDRGALANLKQVLRAKGFKYQSETLNAGRTERIIVDLGSQSPEEVKDIVDAPLPGLQLLDKNDQDARLKAI